MMTTAIALPVAATEPLVTDEGAAVLRHGGPLAAFRVLSAAPAGIVNVFHIVMTES